jgi:hypothetical protein
MSWPIGAAAHVSLTESHYAELDCYQNFQLRPAFYYSGRSDVMPSDLIDFTTSGQWLVALSQAGPGGSNSCPLSTPTFADYERPSNWVALAVGSTPTNNNPTEELAYPAEYSTEFNSPTATMDGQTDIAALGFNLSWFVGISSPAAMPKQFATGGVAVQW